MFDKLKLKLRVKLREWLFITDLEKDFYKHRQESGCEFGRLEKNIKGNKDRIDILHDTVENVVHIGTDVRVSDKEHSWAVVCIEGKMNVVKFVDLNGKNTREILSFLRNFEAGRNCIDTPYKEMIEEGLFKW